MFRNLYKPLFFVLFCILATHAQAQFTKCIDSSIIQSFLPCDSTWAPVCGCNNITYRNPCHAQQSGVTQTVDRTCEDITIVWFGPNPVLNDVNYRLYLKQEGTPYVFIFDMDGNIHYEQYILNVEDVVENLDLTFLRGGVYMMIATVNGHYSAKKFIKLPY